MASFDDIPIVVLPGLDGTGELLATFVERLSAYRRVQLVAYPPDRAMTYDELVALVVERAPRKPFIILGESFSGPIAIEIAAVEKRVVGLVLASSFARHPLPSLFIPFGQLFNASWMPQRLIAAALLGRTRSLELQRRIGQVVARVPSKVIRVRIAEVLRVDKLKQLREVKCPILYLQARYDRMVSRKSLNEIVRTQPQCQIHAPHMLLETHPQAAAEVVDRFCRALDERRPRLGIA